LNGIDPYEDSVELHELFPNFRAKIIVINRWLGTNPFGGEGAEQLCEPVIFGCCSSPARIIARIENRDPSAVIISPPYSHPARTSGQRIKPITPWIAGAAGGELYFWVQ
jgi:hypothetical protein